MEPYKRFLSLWNLCGKFTTKPIAAILTLSFFVQGGFMIFYYRVTDFTFQKQVGFDEVTNSIIYQEQPWFYRFEELLKHCHIDLIFLIGAILLFVVFFVHHTRNESVTISNITYKGLPVSQHTILNIQLVHTFAMIIIFVCTHIVILLFWHKVYCSILPEQVVSAQNMVLEIKNYGFLNQVFPIHNHITFVMNLIGLLFVSVSLLYLPYMRKQGAISVVYVLLGVVSYLFIGRSTQVVGPLVEICIFILCTLEMYLELHKRIRHERRLVMG